MTVEILSSKLVLFNISYAGWIFTKVMPTPLIIFLLFIQISDFDWDRFPLSLTPSLFIPLPLSLSLVLPLSNPFPVSIPLHLSQSLYNFPLSYSISLSPIPLLISLSLYSVSKQQILCYFYRSGFCWSIWLFQYYFFPNYLDTSRLVCNFNILSNIKKTL